MQLSVSNKYPQVPYSTSVYMRATWHVWYLVAWHCTRRVLQLWDIKVLLDVLEWQWLQVRRGPWYLKTYLSVTCNVTVMHGCAVDSSRLGSNVLNLKPKP